MHCIVRGFPVLPSRVGVGSLLALQALAHLFQLFETKVPTEFRECSVVVDDFPSLQVFDYLDLYMIGLFSIYLLYDWVCFEICDMVFLCFPIVNGTCFKAENPRYVDDWQRVRRVPRQKTRWMARLVGGKIPHRTYPLVDKHSY